MNRRFAVITLILCSSIAFAQQSPTEAIRAGRLIDVRTGKVSNNAYVIIGKIAFCRLPRVHPQGNCNRPIEIHSSAWPHRQSRPHSRQSQGPVLHRQPAHILGTKGNLGSP